MIDFGNNRINNFISCTELHNKLTMMTKFIMVNYLINLFHFKLQRIFKDLNIMYL